MTLVRQILLALRTLAEEEPSPARRRRRRPSDASRSSNRRGQTAAIVLTFRDLFRSGGLNFILDEMDGTNRPRRSSGRNSFTTTDNAGWGLSTNALDLNKHATPASIPVALDLQDETTPLLIDDMETVTSCTELVVYPAPTITRNFFSTLTFIRKKKKPADLTVPLSCDNEAKTVETLRKVLKWSPKKQNSATFAVPLPRQEEHEALAVVQNAVNRVKEEQQQKKKKKKFWLKICKI